MELRRKIGDYINVEQPSKISLTLVEKKTIEFIWNVDNFSETSTDEDLISPPFAGISEIEWKIKIRPKAMFAEKEWVLIALLPVHCEKPNELKADYQISLLNSEKNIMATGIFEDREFKGDDRDFHYVELRSNILDMKKGYLSQENQTLSIHCQVSTYKTNSEIRNSPSIIKEKEIKSL